jgi:hypothetical protein
LSEALCRRLGQYVFYRKIDDIKIRGARVTRVSDRPNTRLCDDRAAAGVRRDLLGLARSRSLDIPEQFGA